MGEFPGKPKRYILSIAVEVIDPDKLREAAGAAALRNGFNSVEMYEEARANNDEPVIYDLLEFWPELVDEAAAGLRVSDITADEDGF